MSNRYLLCRPQGGLNDVLCQIERCYQYAKLTDRTLVVDTNYSDNFYFKDDFSKYFFSSDPSIELNGSKYLKLMEDMDVYPSLIKGKLNHYESKYHSTKLRYVEKVSLEPISFNFKKNYLEQLIIHHDCGAQEFLSIGALKKLAISESLKAMLIERYRTIGSSYMGLHIRNTDYQTDTHALVAKIKQIKPERLLIATDDLRTLNYFLGEIDPSVTKIFNFASTLSSGGDPIHTSNGLVDEEIYERNCDAILDLLLLALANTLCYSEIQANGPNLGYSGYSLLARDLFNDKATLFNLIGGSESLLYV